MDTFVLPEQHIAGPVDTERSCTVARQLGALKHEKRRVKSAHRVSSSMIQYMRAVEPDIRDVLGVRENSHAADASDSDSSGSDTEAPEAHTALGSDSAQIRDQLTKCNRYASEIRDMRAELDSMRVRHRRGVRQYDTDRSHNVVQCIAARLHAAAHSTILAAMHSGSGTAKSTAADPVTGRNALGELVGNLKGILDGKRKRSIAGLIRRTLDCIQVTQTAMDKKVKAVQPGERQEHLESIVAFFAAIQEQLHEVQGKIDNFVRLEENFAVGLVAITGIAVNVKTAVRQRLRDIITMLQEMVDKITEYVSASDEADPLEATTGDSELIMEASEAVDEADPLEATTGDSELNMEASEAVDGDAIAPDMERLGRWQEEMNSFGDVLQDQSPIFAAVSRVWSDLRIRYPRLQVDGVDAELLMDPDRNGLHACFQRLVGIDWNMSRRLSGQKVTYASDYNRMANQYRTTTFAFKKARVVHGGMGDCRLVL